MKVNKRVKCIDVHTYGRHLTLYKYYNVIEEDAKNYYLEQTDAGSLNMAYRKHRFIEEEETYSLW